MTIEYASEKYWTGVRNLAVTDGSLQDRLFQAWLSFGRVNKEDLPTDLWGEHESIISALTTVKDGPKDQGYVKNTLRAMSDEEAGRLAERVVDMLFKVEQAVAETA